MKRSIRMLSFLVLGLVGTSVEAGPEEDAAEIARLLVGQDRFDRILEENDENLRQLLSRGLVQRGVAASNFNAFYAIYAEEFSKAWTGLARDSTARYLLEELDPENLAAIAAFYQTADGAALLRVVPGLSSRVAKIAQNGSREAEARAFPRVLDRATAMGLSLDPIDN